MPNSLHVLLIESSHDDGKELSKLLSESGYQVSWFSTLQEATPKLVEHRFDACLLCCQSDGNTLNRLQGALYTIAQAPVLLFLPIEDPELVEKSLRMGAVDVLLKSDGVERMSRKIRYAVARYSVSWRPDSASLRDPLTGIANFIAFQKQLNVALGNARKVKEYEVGVIIVGVDGFKLVNNGLGHSAGDELLIEIARRLVDCLREHDFVSRRAGDEFAILLTGLGIHDSIDIITKRLIKLFEKPFAISNQEVFSSVCLGISLTEGKEDADALIQEADIAMNRAKKKGRGNYEIFLRTMRQDARERLRLENDLRRAVAQREFILYYQPVINLQTNEIAYFEALVRWKHSERGMVSPWVFLSLAEETGLIVPIGWQLLHQACRQVSRWKSAGLPAAVSVNLSAEQFCAPELIGQLNFCLELSGIEPSQLKLEITESSLIENQNRANELLNQIRSLGLHVYLDDFGTGYSSLAYLERFPLHGLKIDRAFVMKVVNSSRRAAILQKIIELGEILNMRVVAEGVETEDELNALRSMKCDMVQGYYYAKPMPAEDVPSFVERLEVESALEVDLGSN